MSWDPTTRRISGPVHMADISAAVNYNSLSLKMLIENGDINKWAKFKPFRNPAIFHDHYSDNATRLNALINSNYGLTPPASNSNIGNTFGTSWEYGRPIFGTHPFRMMDFEYYEAGALAPARTLGDINVYIAYQNQYTFFVVRGPSSAYAIDWGDLPRIKDYYLCVAFSKMADFSGTLVYKTTSQTIANIVAESSALRLDETELAFLQSNGYAYYYICASSLAKTSLMDAALSAQFIACPYDNAVDGTGRFDINTRIVSSIRALAYSQSANPMSDANFNVSPYSVMNCPPYYVHIKATVTAMEDFDTILTEANLEIELRGTFHGPNIIVSGIAPQLYNSSFVRQNAVRIPAGTTTTVYFVIPGQILGFNDAGMYVAPQTGKILTSTMVISQNGYIFGTFRVEAQN